MDHFAVARAGRRADRIRSLEHDGFEAALRQRTSHREADDAGTDDERIDFIHHEIFPTPSMKKALGLTPKAFSSFGGR